MDKEFVIYIHTHTHTYIHIYNGILLSHKKEWNLAIWDGSTGYYAKWNKSHRERQISYDRTYMWNLKNQTNEQTEQKQSHWYREQIGGCQRGGGMGSGEIGQGD